MAYRAEGATVAPQGIIAWTTWCGERWRRRTFRRWKSRQACLELMGSDLTVSQYFRGDEESSSRGTSQWATHWLSHTCTRRPRLRAQQQRRQPKGKQASIRQWLCHTCLFQWRQKWWGPSLAVLFSYVTHATSIISSHHITCAQNVRLQHKRKRVDADATRWQHFQ